VKSARVYVMDGLAVQTQISLSRECKAKLDQYAQVLQEAA